MSSATGPTIWFWTEVAAATASLPHRAARQLIYRISLIVPLLIGL